MIRGINKRIIEISGEDGSCFERIVLFLRPAQDKDSEERMRKMAEDYADGLFKTTTSVSMLSEPACRRWNLKKAAKIALVSLAAIGGIALCFFLF